jgi:hypothetical protein
MLDPMFVSDLLKFDQYLVIHKLLYASVVWWPMVSTVEKRNLL